MTAVKQQYEAKQIQKSWDVRCHTHAVGSVAEVGGAASGKRTRCFDVALTHRHVHALTERRVWGIKQSKSNHGHVYSPVG